MSAAEDSFHVNYSAVLQKLKAILRQAKAAGKLAKFQEAALEFDRRLRTDPLEFGELKSYLKSLDLKMHIAFARPLMVEFGIQEKLRIVIVKRVLVVSELEV
jgi:hypothetical protein